MLYVLLDNTRIDKIKSDAIKETIRVGEMCLEMTESRLRRLRQGIW